MKVRRDEAKKRKGCKGKREEEEESRVKEQTNN